MYDFYWATLYMLLSIAINPPYYARVCGVRMKVNKTLITVDLSYNGLSDDGATALGRYVRINTTLRHLDVTNNRISATGAKVFSTGLKKNENLDILRVRFIIIIIIIIIIINLFSAIRNQC